MIHHLRTPKESPQNWFVASDWHSFHLNPACFSILIKHAMLFPKAQRNLIINGDFLDLSFLMPKNPLFKEWVNRKDGVDEFFLPQWEEEVKWGNDTLDALQSVFNHIVFIHGNHDNPRADVFREQYCPVGYQEHFHLGAKLNLLRRNIGEIKYNDWLFFGDLLALTHGMFHGTSAHKNHYLASASRNVIFGHVHASECTAFRVLSDTRYSRSLPAMCNLNPHYIKNSETNWDNGYAQIIMRPDGRFNYNNHLIIDGKLILPESLTVLTQ